MKEILAGLALIAAIALLARTGEPGTQWWSALLGGGAAYWAVSLTVSAAAERVRKQSRGAQK